MTLLPTLAVATSVVIAGPASAAPRPIEDPIANPDLDRSCGLDVLVVLDESGSIGSAGATDDVRDAFKAFTAALTNTASRIAVAEFSTVARLPSIGSFAPGDYITITDATKPQLDAYVDGEYNPNGRTNWEDALRMGIPNFASRPDPAIPHLTVFITDGDPNTVIRDDRVTDDEYATKVPLATNETQNTNNENFAADRAVRNANNLKRQGSHVLAIAVGSALQNQAALNRLIEVSGPDVYDGSGDFDISTDDIFRVPDFAQLQDALREAAFQLCAPSVTVDKLVDLTPDPNSLDDAVPGDGWEITGTPTVSGGYTWVLPDDTAPEGPVTTQTDGAGFATFQWNTNLPVDSVFTVQETVQPGFTNLQSATECTFRTPDVPDTPLPLDSVGDGSFTATIPQDAIVTCTIVNLADPAPGITIEKYTDGVDADVAPGPTIPVGDAVNWSYLVTNTGNTVLDAVTVTDAEVQPGAAAGPVVSCPQTTLAQGESMTCTATGNSGTLSGGGSFTGQYENLATVTATPSTGGPDVTDSDPSHYTAAAPGISVEKSTNGEDADIQPGPLVAPGDPVTWEYVLTNTGGLTLTGITLDDSELGAVDTAADCTWPAGNPVGQLGPGEAATCQTTGVALAGQYQNIATATGTPDGGGPDVSDSDPSHYFGVVLDVDIEKATNGVDADTPTGPIVEVGSTVSWTYVVTNQGNTPLASWSVTDDQGVAVACPRVVIPPGGTATCSARGTAQPGQYANLGTVTAPSPVAGVPDASDSDPSHYFGAQPQLDLEKGTGSSPGGPFDDADQPTGPFIPVGTTVYWDYVVTNNGNVGLSNLVVVDSDLGDISASCGVATLAPGESTTCAGSATTVTGQYLNLALALALDPVGNLVGDLDPSHYFGADPGIDVEKLTNGIDADTPAEAPQIPVGGPVTWAYFVTNTGNDALDGIVLSDDVEGPIACPQTTLAAGETMVCEASGVATRGLYANTASVTGVDTTGTTVTDTDPSHYLGTITGIDVEKATNGDDADVPTGPFLRPGDPVTWTYTVTNPGDIPIVGVTLVDDQGVTPVFQGGDAGGDGRLDPGETWTYTAEGTAAAGQYANRATVTGRADVEDDDATVTDSDPSHYFGANPAIDIEKTPDDTVVEFGAPHTFDIAVTNTGNLPLTGVVVTDPETPSCDRTIGDLAVGEVVAYSCDVAAVERFIDNVARVTGTGVDGTQVSDSDNAVVAPIGLGGTASIGDTVWRDSNRNGIQDPGEPGIAGARVTVALEPGSVPGAPPVTVALTTDSDGRYLAVGLVAGTYRVTLDRSTVTGSLTTPGEYLVALSAGEQFLDADFGLALGDDLPFTGLDVDRLVPSGIALLILGGVVVWGTRRRRIGPATGPEL